jgi:ABC-type multidrug transport system ATPase subunit
MDISLNNISKRFNRETIFSGLSHVFSENNHTVIQGANGSGKSTLLQIIAGHSEASTGDIKYTHNNKVIEADQLFRHIAFAAPYMELMEELTLSEHAVFHCGLKALRAGIHANDLAELCGLGHVAGKQIRYFSSGMKQRVRLALAILSDTPFLLLDEPTSNLDEKGILWYQQLVAMHSSNRLILVCSNNIAQEFNFCSQRLAMETYK